MGSVECMLCGRYEYEHHDYVPRPQRCKCDATSWSALDEMPAICARYVAGPHSGYCATCEHDEACHTTPQGTDGDREGP